VRSELLAQKSVTVLMHAVGLASVVAPVLVMVLPSVFQVDLVAQKRVVKHAVGLSKIVLAMVLPSVFEVDLAA